MTGFTCFTKSGSQYTITHNDYDNNSKLSGGKFGNNHIDIAKPTFVSKGMPLDVQCLDTANNARLGISSQNHIKTSTLTNVYQIRNEMQKDDVGFER